jgi:hypothetical protein
MTLARWIGAHATALLAAALLVLPAPPAEAQPAAQAFFHTAAQQYVGGNTQAARQTVARGLEAHPDNSRLQALRKKLATDDRQEGGRSSPDGASAQQQSGASRGPQGRQERSAERGERRGDRSEGRAGPQSSRTQPEGPDAEGEPPDAAQPPRRSARQEGASRQRSRALTRAQAARLLGALENQEETLLRAVQGQVQEGERVEKDW